MVVEPGGREVACAGDPDWPVVVRSSVKPFQVLPFVLAGGVEAWGLEEADLALACSSHSGTEEQAARAGAMLARAGLDRTALLCGAHRPMDEPTAAALDAAGAEPTPLHNNCSGKHAGFVCLGCLLAGPQDHRAFLAGYVRPEHPVMREVGAAIEAATGCDLALAPRGTDGCSIPTYGIALRQLALGFARVASGIGLSPGRAAAATRLRRAAASAPFMVGGTGRFDTRVMQALGERVCCKVGAEGMYCAALPEAGLGVAIKVDDGNNSRACEVVMATLIEALVPLHTDGERQLLASLADVTLFNWRGLQVGRLAAHASLRELVGPRHRANRAMV